MEEHKFQRLIELALLTVRDDDREFEFRNLLLGFRFKIDGIIKLGFESINDIIRESDWDYGCTIYNLRKMKKLSVDLAVAILWLTPDRLVELILEEKDSENLKSCLLATISPLNNWGLAGHHPDIDKYPRWNQLTEMYEYSFHAKKAERAPKP